MITVPVVILAAVVALALAVPLVVLLGLRSRNAIVFRVLRALQRDVLNPRQLKTAAARGQRWTIVRHVGRSSGRIYETPVGASPTADGFVIALPYDLRPNWVRNVLAAGSATIVADGAEHAIDEVFVVPIRDTVIADRLGLSGRLIGIRWALVCREDRSVRAAAGRSDR